MQQKAQEPSALREPSVRVRLPTGGVETEKSQRHALRKGAQPGGGSYLLRGMDIDESSDQPVSVQVAPPCPLLRMCVATWPDRLAPARSCATHSRATRCA